MHFACCYTICKYINIYEYLFTIDGDLNKSPTCLADVPDLEEMVRMVLQDPNLPDLVDVVHKVIANMWSTDRVSWLPAYYAPALHSSAPLVVLHDLEYNLYGIRCWKIIVYEMTIFHINITPCYITHSWMKLTSGEVSWRTTKKQRIFLLTL